MKESDLGERVLFWERVMQRSKELYPTEESFNKASVRDLIDICFDIHKELDGLTTTRQDKGYERKKNTTSILKEINGCEP